VRIAVDDFGTGYSSLARLRELPLDEVKIDRSFVEQVRERPEDAAVVRAVVTIADTLGIDVVVEGVEALDDGRTLRGLGCTVGQGYLWSAPVPAEAVDQMLDRAAGRRAWPRTWSHAAVDRPEEGFSDALRTLRHELATPLAILGMALASRDESGHLGPEVVSTLERGVNRIARMVESLDLLEQVDRGTLRPTLGRHDLAALARGVADDLAGAARRTVDVAASGPLPVLADAALVEVVLSNLVSNACKYSPPDTPVSLSVVRSGDGALVEVSDQGPGVPAELVGTIWRKFGRLQHAVEGSGIGLYLARGIARAHGGELRYRPAPGGGSVFVLDLPVDAGGGA
jgi:signal transduction histidine kinase